MEINLNEIVNLEEVKGDINLILFNSKLFNVETMKLVNKIVGELKDAKIEVCDC